MEITSRRSPRHNTEEPEWSGAERVLICLRYGIGDVIMQLPVLAALRHAVPAARITGIGAFPAIQLLEGEAFVDEVVDIACWRLRHRWDAGTAAVRTAFAAWARQSGFDVIFDPSHAAPAVAHAIWTLPLPIYDSDAGAETEALKHGASGYDAIRAAVRAGWGLSVLDKRPPLLRLSRTERQFAHRFLAERGLSESAPIAVSTVASHPLKRWPVAHLERATRELIRAHQRDVLLFQGFGSPVANGLEAHARVHTAPPLHLRKTAALLERCAVLICNDTGLMHLAAAMGTPTVTTFGPTAARLFAPVAPVGVAIESDVHCPHRRTTSLGPPACWSEDRCLIGDRSCTDQIPVEAVTRAASRLLRRRAALSATAGLRD